MQKQTAESKTKRQRGTLTSGKYVCRVYLYICTHTYTTISAGTRTCVLFKCLLTPFQIYTHTVIAAPIACTCGSACTECACVGNSCRAEMNFLSLVCYMPPQSRFTALHTHSLNLHICLKLAEKLKAHSEANLSEPYMYYIYECVLAICKSTTTFCLFCSPAFRPALRRKGN